MLLAALLLPALRSARDKAQTLVCSNNLRQLAVATYSYVSDADGYLPTPNGLAYQGGVYYGPGWGEVLRPYTSPFLMAAVPGGTPDPRVVTRNLAMCPIYDMNVLASWPQPAPSYQIKRCMYWLFQCYVMNMHLRAGTTNIAGVGVRLPRRLISIGNPSACVLYAESASQNEVVQSWTYLYYNPRHGGIANRNGAAHVPIQDANCHPLGFGTRANSVRVDGHVEFLAYDPAKINWDPPGHTAENDAVWYGK